MRKWILLGVAVVALTGCFPEGVPSWAMHVRPARVDVAGSADEIARRVAAELAYPRIADGHVPAEQIALVAVQEIQQRRLADAGLWLALADYRYFQQALLAETRGFGHPEQLPVNVNHAVYDKLVVAEIKLFVGLEFVDELDVINARLWGRGEAEAALQEQLMDLGKTREIDSVSLRDAMSQLRPSDDPSGAVSRYPALVQAFRRRLLDDFKRNRDDNWKTSYYMSRAPIADLRKEAVFVTQSAFEPRVCDNVANSFPLHRQTIIDGLTHPRPVVRANAAATLGLAPTEATRALLEARLPAETDAQVKLVLAFALFRHGVAEHLVTLTGALAACQPATCALPAKLIDWLPFEAKADLEQAPLARIVGDTRIEMKARFFAAAALRDIGKAKPLEPGSIEAMVAAGRNKSNWEQFRDVAFDALEEAEGLTRADIVARLQANRSTPEARNDVLAPASLLARLVKVATAEDLPLLRQMVQRFGDYEGPEARLAVAAVLNIPGEAPNAYLGNWFTRYPRLQTQIGVGLATRDGFPRDKLDRLVDRGDARTEIIVKAVQRRPDARSTLLEYLQNGDVEEKFQAASLAWLFEQSGIESALQPLLVFHDARYYPNDALLRHAAMTSLIRIALIRSKTPSTAPAAPAAANKPTPQ